jgi:glycerol-3-phosphate dehydrogenase
VRLDHLLSKENIRSYAVLLTHKVYLCVVTAEYPKVLFAVLSGPSHAEEVGLSMPTAITIACENKAVAEEIQDAFMSEYFRVYTNDDVRGAELGGALKNIIALGAGISDGVGYGDNAKAALINRGIVEIARLGIAMGADIHTFYGLTWTHYSISALSLPFCVTPFLKRLKVVPEFQPVVHRLRPLASA